MTLPKQRVPLGRDAVLAAPAQQGVGGGAAPQVVGQPGRGTGQQREGAVPGSKEHRACPARNCFSGVSSRLVSLLRPFPGNRIAPVACVNAHPFWIDQPEPKGGHPGNPNPGRKGILAVHAKGPDQPCTILRRVALPVDKESTLELVVSGDPYEAPGKSDLVLQAGVFDGHQIHWFDDKTIDAGTPPSADNWQTLQFPLKDYAGKTVGIVVKVSFGGKVPVMNEEAFFTRAAPSTCGRAKSNFRSVFC
jgi:hypothetical protein